MCIKQSKIWLVQKKKHVTWFTENCHNVKQSFQSDRPHKSNGALMSVIAPSKGNWRRAYGTSYRTYVVGEKRRVTSREKQKKVLNLVMLSKCFLRSHKKTRVSWLTSEHGMSKATNFVCSRYSQLRRNCSWACLNITNLPYLIGFKTFNFHSMFQLTF